jgi:hypothetical protein
VIPITKHTVVCTDLDAVASTSESEEDHDSPDPDMPPLGSGYESDESVGSVESFRTCYEGDHRVLES